MQIITGGLYFKTLEVAVGGEEDAEYSVARLLEEYQRSIDKEVAKQSDQNLTKTRVTRDASGQHLISTIISQL